jgi:predicted rRNA methylase YqxC with S4 and FtsJ domains
VTFAPEADLIALVKPMFELALAEPPSDDETLADALRRAMASIEAAGWPIVASVPSPALGHHGAKELLVHARRIAGADD